MKYNKALTALACTLILAAAIPTPAQDEGEKDWPKMVEAMGASITMYQPQIDSWEGNTFEARAAVSVVGSAGKAPVFGAVWISGHFTTDKATRTVSFYDVTIPAVRFPDAGEEKEQKLIDILEDEMDDWVYEVDLDILLPTLELADRDAPGEADLKHDVPKIIVKHQPAVLILIDGEPKMQEIKDSKLERVVNTPYTIIKDGRDYFLASDTQWFTAKAVMGPWKAAGKLPKDIAKIDSQMKDQAKDQPQPEDSQAGDTRTPEIVVSTEPAELIFIDGKTTMEPIQGNDILGVSNTDSDVIFDIGTQKFYVLLSGRWFHSSDLDNGPWQWVANDEVPISFSDIPSDSDVGYLRASIAGTDESKDALLEQSIPQTAGVKRGNAESNVEYDGQPKFESVETTTMQYAVNTSSSVILAEGAYYWCEQGVWYVSATSTGPWVVCENVPDVIYTIPPSNPLYNVTYVKVYQSTPEVIYVGYTPGYTGSYVSHSCVVYGTGYYYNPWYSPYHYYARPSTWGFHVRWNPWYGWSFGLSYSAGPFHFGVGWGSYGRYGGAWFGPGFYRPYPMPYRGGYRAGYRAGYYHGRHASGRPVHYGGGNRVNNNIYNRPANRDRVATTRDRSTGQRPAVARDKANNVYTDRQGNVFKRNDNGSWDKRDKSGWTPNGGTPSSGDRTRPTTRPTTPSTRPSTPSTRPSTPSTRPSSPSTRPSTPSTRPSTRPSTGSSRPSTRPSSGSLNRDYSSRQRGSSRSTASRPSSSRSAPRGGGGRRR